MPRPVIKNKSLSNVLSLLLIIILALMYPVDFSANSKTSHELVKVSVPEARKVVLSAQRFLE